MGSKKAEPRRPDSAELKAAAIAQCGVTLFPESAPLVECFNTKATPPKGKVGNLSVRSLALC
jgi:hypothetical protein